MPGSRVLIFILTYLAEDHVRSVFERIPDEVFDDDDVHVLCIDDASTDRSTGVVERWARERGTRNLTLLRNPVNQGYGGNQKLGYRFAVDRGFDFVILLHGNAQHAPEMLPEFIERWRSSDADVVLGSRMQSPGSARRGGMPLYKRVGNRVLTAIQSRLTGQRLSEYHTGYRGYSTRFLRRVPFEINTNDCHFDTEILLQALGVGARIEELAIPTHYGDEISRVNGLRYARNVLTATLRYKLHGLGMACSLKFRDLAPLRYRDKTRMLYTSHRMALDVAAAQRPARLLDLGCGPGFIARECEQLGIEVTGVDREEPLPGMMSRFERCDLDTGPPPVDAPAFDMIFLLDVIEHLRDPEAFLLSLRHRSRLHRERRAPLVVLSTPNVAFATVRLNLALGRFPYAERGILDVTHMRLFTRSSLLRMLADCGYAIERVRPVPVPFETVVGGRLGRVLGTLASLLARLAPRLFAFQFMVTCRPRPGVRQLLDASSLIGDSGDDCVPPVAATDRAPAGPAG